MKKLSIQSNENDTLIAQKELEQLKNTTPVAEPAPVVDTPPEVTPPTVPEPEPEPPVAEMDGKAYNYITTTAKAYTGDGSAEKPFTFLCTQTSFVYGSYLNYLKENSYTAIFEIREKNKKSGVLISSWTVNGEAMETAEDASKWSVLDRQEIEEDTEQAPEPETEQEPETSMEENNTDKEYTAAELAKEIAKKENELKKLDLDKRTAELELKKLEAEVKDGTVYATINGTVKTVQDINNMPNDGSAFLSVAGSDGLYVTGALSEMVLDQVTVGQEVTVMSWESGITVPATITDISDYPEDNANYGGAGNPNASYYAYTAYIEDTTGLSNGESVQLTMTTGGTPSSDALYIEKAYIRQEDGKSYAYIADENNRLVKQYVTTGKTMYGQAVEIKSGLSLDDRIAFPYGLTAKEGVKVSDSDSMND